MTSHPQALFEDTLGTCSVAGHDALRLHEWLGLLECRQADDLRRTCTDIEAAMARGEWLALLLDYEVGAWFEPALLTGMPRGAPRLRALRFGQASALTNAEVDQYLLAKQNGAQAPDADSNASSTGSSAALELRSGMTRARYLQAINRIKAHIGAGDCYQVNYTFPISVRTTLSPAQLYQQLRARQPVRYGAWIDLGAEQILSASPELFLETQPLSSTVRRIQVKPMKGTAMRCADPAQDQAQAQALRDSEKNRAENVMIVDLIRNDLARIAAPGSIKVDRLFELEPYPTLWQMTSTVSGRLDSCVRSTSLYDTLAALHPCGSVTGAPKIAACRIAAQLEVKPRGLYCGAIGLLSPDGDWRLNVAIRTLGLTRAREGGWHGAYGVGSGIVHDSDPAQEWTECWLKAAVFGAAARQAQTLAEADD